MMKIIKLVKEMFKPTPRCDMIETCEADITPEWFKVYCCGRYKACQFYPKPPLHKPREILDMIKSYNT